jgi:hypothetical protein
MLSANGILTRFIVTRSDIITNQQSTGRCPSCFAPLATLSYRAHCCAPAASVPDLVPFIIGAEPLDQ